MSSKDINEIKKKDLSKMLSHWFSYGAGIPASNLEKALLKDLSNNIFGYNLIVLEDLGNTSSALQDCPVQNKLILSENQDLSVEASVHAKGEAIPFANDSIDLAVLPHTLDFSVDPQQILREIERVLIPEGRVLIVGFNPISLWGIWRLILRRLNVAPWCGHFFSCARISDWLNLLGFDIENVNVCAFLPPMKTKKRLKYLELMERLGSRYLPSLTGIYVIKAVKKVSTIRPIKPKWNNLQKFGKGAVGTSTRRKIHSKLRY